MDAALAQTAELKKAKANGPTGFWLQSRYEKLVEIKQRLWAKHKGATLRVAPFGLAITGPSAVGKSTLVQISMKVTLNAMGCDTDPQRIVTIGLDDKFDSEMTGDVLGIIFDDVGQGKAAFAQASPTDKIIKLFNNVQARAVKADLHEKGTIFYDHRVGIVTSNFADLGARAYSDKPEACLRRFIHSRIAIKPKFRKAGGVSLDTNHPELNAVKGVYTDVWEITIEECFIFPDKHGKDGYKFRVLKMPDDFPGQKTCYKLDLKQWLSAIIFLAKRHNRGQEALLENAEAFSEMALCQETGLPLMYCECPCCEKARVRPDSLVDKIAEVAVETGKKAVSDLISKYTAPVTYLNSFLGYAPIATMTTHQLSKEVKNCLEDAATPWAIALTPTCVFNTSLFQRTIATWQKSAALSLIHI